MKTIKLIMILITIWSFFFGNLASARAGSSQTSNDLSDQMNRVNSVVEKGFNQLNAGPDSYRILRQSISDEYNQPGAISDNYRIPKRSTRPLIQIANCLSGHYVCNCPTGCSWGDQFCQPDYVCDAYSSGSSIMGQDPNQGTGSTWPLWFTLIAIVLVMGVVWFILNQSITAANSLDGAPLTQKSVGFRF